MNTNTIFFDLRGTIGAVRCSDGRSVLDVYPFMSGVRGELVAAGARLGLICDPCAHCCPDADAHHELLDDAGLDDWFEPELCLFGPTTGPEMFRLARARNGDGRCWYVSCDPVGCAQAAAEGLVPVPHALLARDAAAGEAVRYVKVAGAGAAARVEGIQTPGVVALELVAPATAYAVVSDGGAARLAAAGLRIEALDARVSAGVALFRMRDDRIDRGLASWDSLVPEPRAIVARTDEAVYLALDPYDEIERHVVGARHGNSRSLRADSTLTIGRIEQPVVARSDATWTEAERMAVHAISASTIADDVRWLASAGVAAGATGSRHVRHRGNEAAVDWIERRLRACGGLRVSRHCFPYRGRTLHNVEAELPGDSPALVLVAAHLDSTARSVFGTYDPASHPAPGADDDASGVAAVLAVAQAFVALANATKSPRRTVRFVLFNAEEVGAQGSSAYAHDQVMRGADIAAVFQLDMVGYRSNPDETSRPCEIHIGAFPNACVEARSYVLAGFLTDAIDAGLGGAIRDPQVCSTRTGDQAQFRSDHSQFHVRDYAACLISEDFWANPPHAPSYDPNPNYHSASDTVIVTEYTADISRMVAAAAMRAARLAEP